MGEVYFFIIIIIISVLSWMRWVGDKNGNSSLLRVLGFFVFFPRLVENDILKY